MSILQTLFKEISELILDILIITFYFKLTVDFVFKCRWAGQLNARNNLFGCSFC